MNNLSDTEFKIIVIRMFQQPSDSNNEFNENYTNVKKDIEILNKSHSEIKNTIPDIKNALEGIKS